MYIKCSVWVLLFIQFLVKVKTVWYLPTVNICEYELYFFLKKIC